MRQLNSLRLVASALIVLSHCGIRFAAAADGVSASGPDTAGPRLTLQSARSGTNGCAAFSPDGMLVAMGDSAGKVHILDLSTGAEKRTIDAGEGAVRAVLFSPNGGELLSCTAHLLNRGANAVVIWDVATGREIRRFKLQPREIVMSAALSRDGNHVLTSAVGGTAQLWNWSTAEREQEFKVAQGTVNGVALSPDGHRVFIAGSDHVIHVCDGTTGAEIQKLEGHTSTIHSLDISSDGAWLLTGAGDLVANADCTVRLWSIGAGKETRQFGSYGRAVQRVAFSSGGKKVVVASRDATVRIFDFESGKEIRKLELSKAATVARFSPDDRQILTCGPGSPPRLWNAETGADVSKFAARSAPAPILYASFSARSDRLYFADAAGLHIWNLPAGKEDRSIAWGEPAGVTAVISDDGRRVLVGTVEGSVRSFDANSGKELPKLEAHTATVDAIDLSASGKLALTGARDFANEKDRTARLWDVDTGKQIQIFDAHTRGIDSVAISPDGKYALTGSSDRTARLWDITNGQEVFVFREHASGVTAVAFSPDGKLAATASQHSVFFRDVASGALVNRYDGNNRLSITSLAFSPDGSRVVVGTGDGTLTLFYASNGNPIREMAAGAGAVRSVRFSPNGRWLMGAGADGSVGIWDAKTTDQLCRVASFRDGGWAVIDSEQHYDASNPDQMGGLFWTVGDKPMDLGRYKQGHYEPGLLAKTLGLSKEPIRAGGDASKSTSAP